MRFGFEQSGDIGLLTFSGELTKQHSGEMKTALMKALDRVDHVVFNLEKVTAMDAVCFQLLCMAHRISASLNKRLTIIGFRHRSIKRLFEHGRLRHREHAKSPERGKRSERTLPQREELIKKEPREVVNERELKTKRRERAAFEFTPTGKDVVYGKSS
jgi:anti-anti-sigma factor